MVDVSHIAEILGVILKPRYLFGIWLPCLIVLLVPDSLLIKFGLDILLSSYKGWVTAVFLVTFFLWLSILGMGAWDRIRESRSEDEYSAEYRASTLNHLNSLSNEERFFLQMCVDKNTRTFVGYFLDPHIQSLVNKRLLVPAQMSDLWNHPFTIPDLVWDILMENKKKVLPSNIEEFRTAYRQYETMPDWQRKNFFN